jgi:RimJ/RimL family protein N-acetyltransferase
MTTQHDDTGMTTAPGGRSLVGRHIRLDPSLVTDADGLFTALDHEDVWAGGYSGGPSARPSAPSEWAERIEQAAKDSRAMFTVRRAADEEILGTTSLGDTDLTHQRTHLGWTAYAPKVWGTAVNPECKLLLLTHAFDDCGFGRVKIQTDLINLRSQAAIAKLGAVREGVLRRHMLRPDGTTRDTVVFAVTIDDWPLVRAGLVARVGG